MRRLVALLTLVGAGALSSAAMCTPAAEWGLAAQFKSPDGATHFLYVVDQGEPSFGGDPATQGDAAYAYLVEADGCSYLDVSSGTTLWSAADMHTSIARVPNTPFGALVMKVVTAGDPGSLSLPAPSTCTAPKILGATTGYVGTSTWTLADPKKKITSGTGQGEVGLVQFYAG